MIDTKLHRLGVGAMLVASDDMEKSIRAAASRHIAEASAEAQRRRDIKHAALLLLLLATGKRMADSIAAAIVAGRATARRKSARRMDAELAAAGIAVENTVRPLLVAGAMNRAQEDAAHARVAAESLATQWGGLARHAVSAAERNGDQPYRGISRSGDLFAPRIRRTAATETAHAYNDEHREAAREAERYGIIHGERLMREWSAMADACAVCAPLHGERTSLSGSFPGGAEPGDMHPHCQCIELLVPAEAFEREAA